MEAGIISKMSSMQFNNASRDSNASEGTLKSTESLSADKRPAGSKRCECGSPNCNSLVCLSSKHLSVANSSDSMLSNAEMVTEEENTDVETEDDSNEAVAGSQTRVESVTVVEEVEDTTKLVQCSRSLSSTHSYEDPDWQNQCLCSFRDSKNQLLARYIKHFHETMQYTKHMQKLQDERKCEPCNRNVQTIFSKEAPEAGYPMVVYKRMPAITRLIAGGPLDFLHANTLAVYASGREPPEAANDRKIKCVQCPDRSVEKEDDKVSEDITPPRWRCFKKCSRRASPTPSSSTSNASKTPNKISVSPPRAPKRTWQRADGYRKSSYDPRPVGLKSAFTQKNVPLEGAPAENSDKTTFMSCECSPERRGVGNSLAAKKVAIADGSADKSGCYHSTKFGAMCLRKLFHEQVRRDRATLLQEQKDFLKNKGMESGSSRPAKGAPNNRQEEPLEEPAGPKWCTPCEHYRRPAAPLRRNCDSCEDCLSDYFISTQNKQVSCQPVQADNATETRGTPVAPSSTDFRCCSCRPRSCPSDDNPLFDFDFELPHDCTCGNLCRADCTHACAKPCTFATQRTAAYPAAPTQPNPPYAARCRGPRYCMNLVTPYKSFYPATAVQVNSMELMRRPHVGRAAELDAKTLRTYLRDVIEGQLDTVLQDLQGMMGPRLASPELPSPLTPSVRESRAHIDLRQASDQQTQVTRPSGTADTSEEESLITVRNPTEKAEPAKARRSASIIATPSVAAMAKTASPTPSPAADPPPNNGAAQGRRESKRVSLKYDFPLYNEQTAGAIPAKASATDSIEERIRILRQNLEQRRDFDSEAPSSRSQTTILSIKDHQISVGDELGATEQVSQLRAKFNSSGRIMKK